MTYSQPEVVELLRATQSIHSGGDDRTGDKGSAFVERGEEDHGGHSSTGAAYQADE